MSYREENLERFDLLERALNEGTVPEGFEALGESLKAKLAKEKDRYLSEFKSDHPERLRAPSMGVIEVVSEKTEYPEWFFGTDLRSRNRVRITLSHASVDPNTQEVFKEGVISELVLSEKQFADVILNLDWGIGFPVTQWTRLGVPVDPVSREDDPTRHNFQQTLDGVASTGHVHEAIEQLRDAIAEGKILKRDADNLARDLDSSVGLLAVNAAHSMDRITEAYAQRVAEASMIIHIDSRSAGAPLIGKDD